VVVVEAFPGNAVAIEERARAKGITNVTVIPKGAWSAAGKQTLYVHPQWSASNIILDSGATHDRAMAADEYAVAVEIVVDRLDDILLQQGIRECDFVKITVMGSEIHVLQGMDRLLGSNTTLWIKAHSTVEGAPANTVVAEMLGKRGFRTVIVRGNRSPGGSRRPGDVYAMPASPR
jgi:FkbM family methyltransferase